MDERRSHEYTATLRVFSKRLKLVELEAQLGKPTEGHEIGDPVSRQRPDGSRHQQAYWGLKSSIERTVRLDEHIDELLAFAEGHRDALDSVRASCSIDIFCGVFTGETGQGGFTFEPAISQRLGDLQLPVGFDVYSVS